MSLRSSSGNAENESSSGTPPAHCRSLFSGSDRLHAFGPTRFGERGEITV